MATGAFAVCFAVFGSVSAMMPLLKKRLGLSPAQIGVALAIPVLLSSLGRIPLGMLSDRLGARRIFLAALAASALAAAGVAEAGPSQRSSPEAFAWASPSPASRWAWAW